MVFLIQRLRLVSSAGSPNSAHGATASMGVTCALSLPTGLARIVSLETCVARTPCRHSASPCSFISPGESIDFPPPSTIAIGSESTPSWRLWPDAQSPCRCRISECHPASIYDQCVRYILCWPYRLFSPEPLLRRNLRSRNQRQSYVRDILQGVPRIALLPIVPGCLISHFPKSRRSSPMSQIPFYIADSFEFFPEICRELLLPYTILWGCRSLLVFASHRSPLPKLVQRAAAHSLCWR